MQRKSSSQAPIESQQMLKDSIIANNNHETFDKDQKSEESPRQSHKRKRDMANLEDQETMSEEYKAQLINLENNIKFYQEQGYTPLIHRRELGNIPLPENCEPLKDYNDANQIPMVDRLSIRLFTKDDLLYKVSTRLLLTKLHPPLSLMPEKPTPHIFLIVLKRLRDNQHAFELRVAFNIDAGHPQLLRDFEYGAIVAAGEIFTKKSKLFFADDKTGHFYGKLKNYKTEYHKIFNLFFPPEKFDYTYYYLPELTLNETEKLLPEKEQKELLTKKYYALINEELNKLGFYETNVSMQQKCEANTNGSEANSEANNKADKKAPPVFNAVTQNFTTFSTPKDLQDSQKKEEAQLAPTLDLTLQK